MAIKNFSLYPMAKTKIAKNSKIQEYINMHIKGEFSRHPTNELYCNFCNVVVSVEKKSHVDAHRRTKKHTGALLKSNNLIQEVSQQSFFSNEKCQFLEKLVKGLLSADIPLSKLNNKDLRMFFKHVNVNIPSESTVRAYVLNNYAKNAFVEMKTYFEGEKMFIYADESEIRGVRYFNLLAGKISTPHINYVIDVFALAENVQLDADLVISIINSNFKKYNIEKQNLKLVVTDAASYMIRAFKNLKIQTPDFYHVTCVAHLIHNCAMRIRAYYSNVDKCISSVKAITIKNRTITALFKTVGKPPTVIVTRWSSWLKASLYYAEHLPIIKNIINSIDGQGILISKAKDAINNTFLTENLTEIVSNYSSLIEILENFEDSKYNIETGYETLMKINFAKDPVLIKEYLTKRLGQNEISDLLQYSNSKISPETYALLKKCIPTSLPVERSFSMLKKMLSHDRNFNSENIYSYFAPYYNTMN